MANIIFMLSSLVFYLKSTDASCLLNTSYDPSNIHFTLHNHLYPQGITPTPNLIPQNTPVTLLIHGWSETTTTSPWIRTLSDLYIGNQPDLSVIWVDYAVYSMGEYFTNACLTEQIGKTIVDTLVGLGLNGERLKCVGFSLGAQLCGAAGREAILRGQGMFQLIKGLDAAGPGFDRLTELDPNTPRLHSGDAKLVIGYYTSGDALFGFGADTAKPYADYNVMVNGGSHQPGCDRLELDFDRMNDLTWKQRFFCNHIFVRQIEIRSQRSNPDYFITSCNSWEDYEAKNCFRGKTIKLSDLPTSGLDKSKKFYFMTDAKFRQIIQFKYNFSFGKNI